MAGLTSSNGLMEQLQLDWEDGKDQVIVASPRASSPNGKFVLNESLIRIYKDVLNNRTQIDCTGTTFRLRLLKHQHLHQQFRRIS